VHKYRGSETPTDHTESFSVTEPYWKMKITAEYIGDSSAQSDVLIETTEEEKEELGSGFYTYKYLPSHAPVCGTIYVDGEQYEVGTEVSIDRNRTVTIGEPYNPDPEPQYLF